MQSKPSSNLLNYMAGFFDGEGCIIITKKIKGSYYVVEVTIGNTNKKPLLLFKKYFDGTLLTAKRREHYKIIYTWRIQAKKAEKFLRAITPYLIIKQKKAIIALELRDLFRAGELLSRGMSKTKTKDEAILAEREEIYKRFREEE